MENIKRLLCGFIILAIISAILAGCTAENDAANEITANTTENETSTSEETTYPELKIEVTIDGEGISESMDYYFIPDDKALGTWEFLRVFITMTEKYRI